MRRVLLLVVATLVVFGLLTSSGSSAPPSVAGVHGQWERIPAAPLSPRYDSVGVALDDALLIVGGTAEPPCPPNASCRPSGISPFRDGAIFDFGTGRWHRIARAPVPLTWARTAVVGDSVYFLQPASAVDLPLATYLRYDLRADTWEVLPRAPLPRLPSWDRDVREYDGRLVAFSERVALAYDPSFRTWTPMPHTPMLHSDIPPVVADQIREEVWRHFVRIGEIYGWVWADGKLVNPHDDVANGTAPNRGGILDVLTGELTPLPAPYPPSLDDRRTYYPRVTFGWGNYAVGGGKVLDVSSGEWGRVPPLPVHLDGGEVSAAVGDRVVVWGGFRGYGRVAKFLVTGFYWRIAL